MSDQVQQPTPAVVQQTTVINVGNRKSVAGAVVLALLFGPLGMIYSTVVGAVVMFFVNLLVAIPTLGLGLILTIPIGAVWAGVAASNHNNSLGTLSMQAAAQPASPASPAAVPAGWHPDPEGSNRLRYWDGSSWTGEYADRPSEEAEVPVLTESSPPATGSFCESCGEKVGATDRFCPGCGAKRESDN